MLRLISSEVLWFCENDHVETREPRKTILYEKELFRAFASLLHKLERKFSSQRRTLLALLIGATDGTVYLYFSS